MKTNFKYREGGRVVFYGYVNNLPRRLILEDNLTVEVFKVRRKNLIHPEELDNLKNITRGVYGLEIQFRGEIKCYSPFDIISSNRTYPKVVDSICKEKGVTRAELEQEGKIYKLIGTQELHSQDISLVDIKYGTRYVDESEVTVENIRKTAELLGLWLVNNPTVYKYWPSRGEVAPSDNPIRSLLGKRAEIVYVEERFWNIFHPVREGFQKRAWGRCTKNLENYLQKYTKVEYRECGDRAFVDYNGEAKLGATALAALAIGYGKSQELEYELFHALVRTTFDLQQPDGSFRTFLFPEGRANDNQNFYPGETLLLWAYLHQWDLFHTKPLLKRIYKSFNYYRDWHRAHRNPAFIPWHTQACSVLYNHTHCKAFRDFIFEMNDWLLPMQQWSKNPLYTNGRFYDPKHPEYGPPHSSSTGAYLEGLVDAYGVAKDVGDTKRAEAYLTCIKRGIRSIMQLQFKDELDAFYVNSSKLSKVIGGVKTTIYDNTIRVDNVAHACLALHKLLWVHPEGDEA